MVFKKRRTYLDAAAATPVAKGAAKAFLEALSLYGNPSAPHKEGKTAHDLLERSRAKIATLLGVKKEAVIFTGTATEANALALFGYLRPLMKARTPEKVHVLYSPISHASVIETLQMLEAEGCNIEPLHLIENAIDLEKLKTQIRKETVLVSCDFVCGETGTLFRTRDIRRILDARESPSRPLLHIDASQAPLVESIVLQHVGADMLTFDAQKIGGVRGIGVLVSGRTIPLAPLYGGGGQERGLRSGTVSPALASACATALEESVRLQSIFTAHTASLKALLLRELEMLGIPFSENGGVTTVPHILNISFEGYDTDYLVALLDEAGFAVSTKSACETNAEGSRVVRALTNDERRARSTLRISFTRTTSKGDIRAFVKACKRAFTLLERV